MLNQQKFIIEVFLRWLPTVIIQFKTYLYRSDVILVIRAWNLRGPVNILKQGAGLREVVFEFYLQRKRQFFYYNPKLFKIRTVRMLITSF